MPTEPNARAMTAHAYAFADAAMLRRFAQGLTRDGESRTSHVGKTQVTLRFADDQYVVAHDFGSLVFLGVPAAERERVLTAWSAFAGKDARPLFVEDFTIEIAPGTRPVVKFDRLLIDQLSASSAELLALALGQSTVMESYETDVDGILARMDRIAGDFVQRGAVRRGLRPLIRFIGEAMQLRSRVLFNLALLDAPAAAWDNEMLDRLYRELRSSFALDERYRALDHKLSVIRDNLELLVDLTQQKRSMMLEVSIVALIVVEVMLAIFQR